MSRALAIADQMAIEARLLPELSTSTVSVYRQQNVASEIENAINKARGSAVVIVWDGCDRPEEAEDLKGRNLRVVSRYNVQCFFAPVLKPDGRTVDDIAEALMVHFDNWTESHKPTNRDTWMRFRGASLTPEDGWLLYELAFDKVIQFSNQS